MTMPPPDKGTRGSLFGIVRRLPPAKSASEQVVVPVGAGERSCRDALLELRAEIQQLQAVLGATSKGEPVTTHSGYIRKTMKDMRELMPYVVDTEQPEGIRRVHNYWEQMQSYPLLMNPGGDLKPEEQAHQINALNSIFAGLLWEIGYSTIPETVRKWLAGQRPGYYVPFNDVFEDELPDPEARAKMLKFLRYAPKSIRKGLVDEENGFIYRYSQNMWQCALSYLLVIAVFVLSAGAAIAPAYVPIKEWPSVTTLAVGWLAVLGGVVAHLLVGANKRIKDKGGRPPILAVGEWLLWVDAKTGPIALKLLLTLVGFYGFIALTGVSKTTPWGFFLVGYSLDSFVELFGSTVGQKAATQAEAIKKSSQPAAG